MKLPLQISFRNMDKSDWVEQRVQDLVEKLETFCHTITSCRVVIERYHGKHAHGNQYLVRIDITVPGTEIVLNRTTDEEQAHADLNVALHAGFDAAKRQLEDYVRKQRGSVKAHEVVSAG